MAEEVQSTPWLRMCVCVCQVWPGAEDINAGCASSSLVFKPCTILATACRSPRHAGDSQAGGVRPPRTHWQAAAVALSTPLLPGASSLDLSRLLQVGARGTGPCQVARSQNSSHIGAAPVAQRLQGLGLANLYLYPLNPNLNAQEMMMLTALLTFLLALKK